MEGMMFGSKVDSTGKEVTDGSSYVKPLVGERVPGNKLTDIEFVRKDDGKESAKFTFTQSNGAKLIWVVFAPENEKQLDSVNTNTKHLCTKYVTEEEFHALQSNSFESYINGIKGLILDKASALEVTMKIVYNKKGYASLPYFPNWIALPGKEDTLSTNPRYDFYEVPEKTSPAGLDFSSDDDEDLF